VPEGRQEDREQLLVANFYCGGTQDLLSRYGHGCDVDCSVEEKTRSRCSGLWEQYSDRTHTDLQANTRHNNTVTIYGLITAQIMDIAYDSYETTNDTTLLCTALLILVLPVTQHYIFTVLRVRAQLLKLINMSTIRGYL
jgi:hypothetical protein